LDAGLSSGSLRLGDIHFGQTTVHLPDNRISYQTTVDLTATHGVLVEVVAGVDAVKNEAFWIFRSIDPLTGEPPTDPLLGFLPPNDETGRGQGWVEYTIKPKANVPTGTVIRNKATIVFDVNEPIETNEWFNTIDADAPESAVAAIPAVSLDPNIPLTWTGFDPEGGAGLATYTIYVSTDGDPFVPFITSTTDESGVFTGALGHTYAFHSRATDNVGNVEDAPATPDAVITVGNPNAPPTCDAGGPYVAECAGLTTTIALDGSASADPDPNDTLSFAWTTDCAAATFDDPTSPTPVLTLPASCPALPSCNVSLTVTDAAGASDSCSASLSIQDATPPQIACPPDGIVECDGTGNLTELEAFLASASASEICGTVAMSDDFSSVSPTCGAAGSALVTWTATDACNLSSACSATFAIVDTSPPTMTLDTTPIMVVDADCSGAEAAVLPSATATDTCAEAIVTHDAPATFPTGETTTVTFIATDPCGNSRQETVDVKVMYGANIAITAARHTVGTGSNPGSVKEPLVGIGVCAYDAAPGSCARVVCGGISHRQYECIAIGDRTPGSPCDATTCCTTDALGQCTLDVPPGDYVVISADATKTVLPDPLGVSAGELACGEIQQKYLQQIVKADGQKTPAKTTRLTGSELLIIEPEYVVWDASQQLYPFVFESVGDWGVTAIVTPPNGFVSDYPELVALVNDDVQAVQFTIIEVGSDLVPTVTEFRTEHGGSQRTVDSAVDIYLTSAYARSRGLDVRALQSRGLIKDRPGKPKPPKPPRTRP
jgi:hypothetical protein